jgi:preprotein translocase subunit SecB
MADENTRSLQILKIYLKDCSVESPNSPDIFAENGETQFKLDLDVKTRKVGPETFETVLSISARAAFADKTLFLAEVHQAALLDVKGFPEEEHDALFGIWTPTQLYPFAREVVATLCSHAGFPQVVLPLVNFEQYHAMRKQQEQDQLQGASGAAN